MSNSDIDKTMWFEESVQTLKVEPSLWRAKGVIKRRDTGETVPSGAVTHGKSKEEAISKLKIKLKADWDALSKPSDWRTSNEIRLLVKRFVEGEAEIKANLFKLLKSSPDEENERYCFEFKDKISNFHLEITKKLSEFSENQKEKAISSAPETYEDILDPWNLEEVYAKKDLFKYILSPTDRLMKVHQSHLKKMNEAFDKNELKNE